MDKKEIREQLKEIATAANSLAGAISSLTVRLHCDVMVDMMGEDECNHCGQDADMDDACCQAREQQESGEDSVSLKELLGMEVVGVGKGKCDGCPMDHYQADCCKVELVGGDYICSAKPRPEEEDGDNVMGDIREKAEAFIDYLDSVIGD